MTPFRICFLTVLSICISAPTSSAQDSLVISVRRGKIIRPVAAPLLLFIAGAYSVRFRDDVRKERNAKQPNFHSHLDNYLQYSSVAFAFGLTLAGVEGKNDLVNKTALLIKSELLMTVLVQSLKYSTHELRPDGSNHLSFPSGHTAQAFAAATFLHKEYGRVSVWYSIGGYTAAGAVGALRILNNKHWISDVLVGAGIGVLSTNLVYLTHQYRWTKNRKAEVSFTPTYGNGPGVYFCYSFR